MGSTRQIRVERQYEIRLAVIIRGYRKQGCLPKARRKVIRDTHASEEVKAGFTDGLKFPLVTRQCRARLLRTHKWDLMRSLELPKMQCRQGYARTFHTIAIIQRHGVYEWTRKGEEKKKKKEKEVWYVYAKFKFRFWSDIEEGNQGKKKTIFLALCSVNKSFFFFLNIFRMKK